MTREQAELFITEHLRPVFGFALKRCAGVADAEDLSQAAADVAGLFGGLPLCTQEALYCLRSYGVVFAVSILGATPLPKKLAARIPEKAMAVLEPLALICLLLVCTAYLVDGSFNPFLYFRF